MIRLRIGKVLSASAPCPEGTPTRRRSRGRMRFLQLRVLARVIDVEPAARAPRSSRPGARAPPGARASSTPRAKPETIVMPASGQLAGEARGHVPPVASRRPRPDDRRPPAGAGVRACRRRKAGRGIGNLGERMRDTRRRKPSRRGRRRARAALTHFPDETSSAERRTARRPLPIPAVRTARPCRRRQKGLDPARGAQDRPETLRRQLAPARQEIAARRRTGSRLMHCFNVSFHPKRKHDLREIFPTGKLSYNSDRRSR